MFRSIAQSMLLRTRTFKCIQFHISDEIVSQDMNPLIKFVYIKCYCSIKSLKKMTTRGNDNGLFVYKILTKFI